MPNDPLLDAKIKQFKDDEVKAAKAKMLLDEQNKQAQQEKHAIDLSKLAKKNLRDAKDDVAKEKTDKAIENQINDIKRLDDSKGYDSFLSGMLAIVGHCHLIAEANPLGRLIGSVAGAGASAMEWALKKANLMDQDTEISLGAAKDAILTSLEKKTPPKQVKLPDLEHFVEFTDQDKLNIASMGKNMRRSDGEEITADQEAEFQKVMEKGVTLWLDKCGYLPVAGKNDEFVSKTDGSHLTQAQFEALRDDPDHGLNVFLSGAFDMDMEQAPGPRPAGP